MTDTRSSGLHRHRLRRKAPRSVVLVDKAFVIAIGLGAIFSTDLKPWAVVPFSIKCKSRSSPSRYASAFVVRSRNSKGNSKRNSDNRYSKKIPWPISFDDTPVVSLAATESDCPSSHGPPLLSKRLEGLDAPTVWHEFSPLSAEHQSINLGQGFPDWDPPKFLIEELKRSTDPEYERVSHSNDTASLTETLPIQTANQYARSYAHLPLATALRNDYANYQWRDSDLPASTLESLDAASNVATATGVTNVLYCALQGLIDPGDEVLLMEPFFDIYSSQVALAGGKCVYCPLRSVPLGVATDPKSTGDNALIGASEFFKLDLEELASKITPRTKVLILNTPHNPTGKIFSRTELEGIADLVASHPNLVVISDEVYQHIVFDGCGDGEGNPSSENGNRQRLPHISIATVNRGKIWNQTLTMSSAGKTFSCTGWKVGWAIGPSHLIKAVTAIQQWCNFSPVTPTQDAIARALVLARKPYQDYNSYYEWLAADYGRKRSILIDALENAGSIPGNGSDEKSNLQQEKRNNNREKIFRAVVPDGGFFIMADTSGIDFPYEEIAATQVTSATPRMVVPSSGGDSDQPPTTKMPRDWALSRWLTTDVGVTAIPPCAFYGPDHLHLASDMLRFAFCKNEDTLMEASKRLKVHFSGSATDSSPHVEKQNCDSEASATKTSETSLTQVVGRSDTNDNLSEDQPQAKPWTSAIVRISYDGSKFTGWSAANKGNSGNNTQKRRKHSRRRGYVEEHAGRLPAGFVRSVEGVIKENLAKLYGDVDPNTRIVVEGCSRTDKGVHATCMIAQVYCLKEGFSTANGGKVSSLSEARDGAVIDEDEAMSSIVVPGKRIPHPSTPTDNSCFEPLPMNSNLSRIAFAFNRMRPSDIQVTGIAPTPKMVPSEQQASQPQVFHASLSSKSKTYVYRLSTGYLPDPTQRKATWHVGSSMAVSSNSFEGLDLASIRQACALLLGTHDFSAFQGAARGAEEKRKRIKQQQSKEGGSDGDGLSNSKNCVCTLYDLRIELQDPLGIHNDFYFPGMDPPLQNYRILVRGDRFLYKMVRFLVGSLVAVGTGKLRIEDIERAIVTGSWVEDGKRTEFECAPAHGLTLSHVDYGEELAFDWQPLRDPSCEPRNKKHR